MTDEQRRQYKRNVMENTQSQKLTEMRKLIDLAELSLTRSEGELRTEMGKLIAENPMDMDFRKRTR